jgi:DNA-directed RNA polymerase specialized sigma subunit
MGVSNYDKEGSNRRLEAMYVLTTAEGVEELLGMWDKIILMPYERGDYGVVDLIIDTEIAIERAGLTAKQRTALDLVLRQGYTQKEVSQLVGVSPPAINKLIARGTEKISDVFTKWTKQGAY